MPVPMRKAAAAVALVAVGFLGGARWADARTPDAGSAPAAVPVAQPSPEPPCGGGGSTAADRALT